MLTKEEFGVGLVCLTADGCPVNGVCARGAPTEVRDGANLAARLQALKSEHCAARLLLCWCASHRIDLICKRHLAEHLSVERNGRKEPS